MSTSVFKRGLALRFVLSALMVPTAGSALAQDAGKTIVLEPLKVLGNQEDATGPVGDSNNPPTVTGSKAPVFATEVPQSLSILGREDLERFNADSVSESLRYTPGVTADVFGNDTDYDWLRIRGFQADQTGTYLDNAQNLSFAFGSFYIDPYALERIEVLRGPSSALYGGSNPGGIVNYISKRPGERVREVVLGIEDAPAASLSFDYGDPLENGQAYRVIGKIKGGDKYDDPNEGVRGTLAPSYKFETSHGTEVTLLANAHVADEKHNGSTFLPYAGTVTATDQFGYIDRDANFSDEEWDSYKREQFSATAIAEHTFDNNFTLTGIGRAGVASVEERYYYPFGYAGYATTPSDAQGTLSLIAFEHDTLVRTAQTDIRYYGTVHTGPVSHDLLFGLDARYYWLDETQASGFGTNQVVNPTNPGTPTLGAPYQDATTTQSQTGLYVQDQLRFGDGWIVTGNLRHDFVETEQDGAAGFERSDSESSWRAAVGYEFPLGITPYVSYSSFFNPLITSPANGVTEPETGEQVEAGVKWAPEGENFYLMGAVFQIDRENVVTGAFPNYNQLGAVRSTGFEFEGGYQFGFGLTLAATATVLDAEVTEDTDASLIGNTPTLIPDHELTLRAEYAFQGPLLDGVSIGAGVRHRGESYANDANTLTVPDATLFDLYAGYELSENLDLNLSATNVADKRYVTGCQTEYVCSYGAGREVMLTLKATW
ncbi:TonB-dependent siderophore receptor [Thalassobaculum sp. OXR-137]|uniref:TonB-dependent siderophore receptor n=1 Tax=Thalassobaculum sp. OXR-137 TaxID=3100173 RepID=UPI002AC92725|nr:TonB-dependent siderophore receptor [Thalassobaculum sp. OXR-137]WPZ34002.1 TonB-dependent siderophore receptor [Thalassobaculum sp. OXR-137]